MTQPSPFPSVTFPKGQFEEILKRHEEYKENCTIKIDSTTLIDEYEHTKKTDHNKEVLMS
jgi:hypothetical protein